MRPFGEYVERLSPFWDKSYVDESIIQTDDFEQPTFGTVIGRKPLLAKGLRKFKRLHRDLPRFGSATIAGFELGVEPSDAVTQLGRLARERLLLDLFEQPQVKQLVLLTPHEGELPVQLNNPLTALLLLSERPFTQNSGEPIADLLVLDTELVEESEHLLVEIGFGQANPRVPCGGVSAASVVPVDLRP